MNRLESSWSRSNSRKAKPCGDVGPAGTRRAWIGAVLSTVLALAFAGNAHAQTRGQASLTLTGSNAALCLNNVTDWSLTKTSPSPVVQAGEPITWTVTATRGATSSDTLKVSGFVAVTNTGSAPATIGNIVVNLQRQRIISGRQRWVSASVDVADATSGDAATSAKIVAAASQETVAWNALWNAPATYAVSGSQGTFSENAGSGSLSFTDADGNTAWAITPQVTIPVGSTVRLLFQASYNNSVLGIAPGESVRSEVIVSFGNAGARGGSGATATNIDINGNGGIDPDEANVRSVPTRLTNVVPALERCHDTVTLTDPGLAVEGAASVDGFDNGGIGDGLVISESGTYTVTTTTVNLPDADDSGIVCNTAYLSSPSDTVEVVIGTDPGTGLPILHTFVCCDAVDLSAEDCVTVVDSDEPPRWGDGDFATYSQGGYGGPGAPYQLLADNFASVFSEGIEIGIPGAGGYSLKFTSAAAVQAFLPAKGTASVLTADLINPTSSSAGVFAGQVLTLKINIALSDAGVTPNALGSFGDLYYNDQDGAGSLHNKTVREILAAMEVALGGGPLPAGYTISSLNALADSLNTEAFHEGLVGSFAQYLSLTPWP